MEITYRYPNSEQKTMLAREIVNTYPASRDSTPGMKGHVIK